MKGSKRTKKASSEEAPTEATAEPATEATTEATTEPEAAMTFDELSAEKEDTEAMKAAAKKREEELEAKRAFRARMSKLFPVKFTREVFASEEPEVHDTSLIGNWEVGVPPEPIEATGEYAAALLRAVGDEERARVAEAKPSPFDRRFYLQISNVKDPETALIHRKLWERENPPELEDMEDEFSEQAASKLPPNPFIPDDAFDTAYITTEPDGKRYAHVLKKEPYVFEQAREYMLRNEMLEFDLEENGDPLVSDKMEDHFDLVHQLFEPLPEIPWLPVSNFEENLRPIQEFPHFKPPPPEPVTMDESQEYDIESKEVDDEFTDTFEERIMLDPTMYERFELLNPEEMDPVIDRVQMEFDVTQATYIAPPTERELSMLQEKGVPVRTDTGDMQLPVAAQIADQLWDKDRDDDVFEVTPLMLEVFKSEEHGNVAQVNTWPEVMGWVEPVLLESDDLEMLEKRLLPGDIEEFSDDCTPDWCREDEELEGPAPSTPEEEFAQLKEILDEERQDLDEEIYERAVQDELVRAYAMKLWNKVERGEDLTLEDEAVPQEVEDTFLEIAALFPELPPEELGYIGYEDLEAENEEGPDEGPLVEGPPDEDIDEDLDEDLEEEFKKELAELAELDEDRMPFETWPIGFEAPKYDKKKRAELRARLEERKETAALSPEELEARKQAAEARKQAAVEAMTKEATTEEATPEGATPEEATTTEAPEDEGGLVTVGFAGTRSSLTWRGTDSQDQNGDPLTDRVREEERKREVQVAEESKDSIFHRFSWLDDSSTKVTGIVLRREGSRSNFSIPVFTEYVREDLIPDLLQAYWNGDYDQIDDLCTEEMADQFKMLIDERERMGRTIANRLIEVQSCDFAKDALSEEGDPLLLYTFSTQEVAMVTDLSGQIVEGGPSNIKLVRYGLLMRHHIMRNRFVVGELVMYSSKDYI